MKKKLIPVATIKTLLLSGTLLLVVMMGVMYYWPRNEVKFLLTSEGATATSWLTNILNSFPEVSCTQYDRITLNGNDNLHVKIDKISMQEYFAIQKKYAKKKARVLGNVHGFLINTALDKNPSPAIRIANIIRHPISHIDSMYMFWLKNEEFYKQIQAFVEDKQNQDSYALNQDHYSPPYREAMVYADKLQSTYGIAVSNDVPTWIFLTILARFDRVHDNMQKADRLNIPQYKFEEFTTNKDVLKKMLRYISNDKVLLSEDKLERLVQVPAQNVNRKEKLSESDIYNSWDQTRKFAFALHLNNIGGIANTAYAQHGYDLSFVTLN